MTRFSATEIDQIVKSCLNSYNKLPKNGKPIDKEWTVLSCVVKYDSDNDKHEVVSLGTGSKCVGATKMSPTGDVVNDSHAEVFARRGFLLYLYDQLNKNESSIFKLEGTKYKLKENINFIFYSSQLPCGDASIMPKVGEVEDYGELVMNKRKPEADICDTEDKKLKLSDDDIHRTGAKCLPDSEQDPKDDGSKYHVLGQVRTKPGRGDRTLSVSCSDKLARWIHVGIQGSLLDLLLFAPIFIRHFIFGAGVPYSEESLNRALFKRDGECLFGSSNAVQLYQSSLVFPNVRNVDTLRPAPGSIVWANTSNRILDVAVQGKKIGVIKKKAHSPSSFLCVSKFKIYETFQRFIHKNELIKQAVFGDEDVKNKPYNAVKVLSKRYQEHWTDVKVKFFKTWTKKPDIWDFCVNISV